MADYDVLIAGGGPVGGALALALRDTGLKFGVLESQSSHPTSDDPRPLALSHGTRLILERIGLWHALAPVTPIYRIHVSQRGGFGRVMLDAAEAELPALGYVLDYTRLAAITAAALRQAPCDYLTGAEVRSIRTEPDAAVVELAGNSCPQWCSTKLVVIAEGGKSFAAEAIRSVDYGQCAVTARLSTTAAHHQTAYERFTPEGPLALLPFDEKLALVWTTAPEHAQDLCTTQESVFLSRLQETFGDRVGRFTAAERRALFPLTLKVARRVVGQRVVRIGNAAQTLHPVAGQGLNLGVRDAWELATEVKRWPREEIGAARLLGRYAARRRLDRTGGIWFTHNLVRIFSGDLAAIRFARGAGLAALGAMPPLKDFVVRRMTFGARG
jgi:2-octaprenyl-6-methoxyphenol hydroxylase